MSRYVIAVRRWWTVPLALILLVLVCGTAGASKVPVPSLTGGMAGAQLAYFTPVLVVVAVMYCLERQLQEAEGTAVVPIHRFDHGALVLTVLLGHIAGLVTGMDVARNITLLLALALVTRRLANEATAAAAGLLFLILNLIIGRAYDPSGHATHTWWAVALYPAGSVTAWLFTVTLFTLALALSGTGRRA
jgi:positive regulator of sigma E activity